MAWICEREGATRPLFEVRWYRDKRRFSKSFPNRTDADSFKRTIPPGPLTPKPLRPLSISELERGWVEIPLTRGLVTIIDVVDYYDVAQFKWYAHFGQHSGPYARRKMTDAGRTTRQWLHRRLMPGRDFVDHINGDGLDNRRANLRPATHTQNVRNLPALNPRNTTGYRGVSRGNGQWRSCIRVDGRTINLGTFDTPEEAARVYDAAAIEHFGEFHGYLNFPEETTGPLDGMAGPVQSPPLVGADGGLVYEEAGSDE